MILKFMAQERGFAVEKNNDTGHYNLVDLEKGHVVRSFPGTTHDPLTVRSYLEALKSAFENLPNIRTEFETMRDEIQREIYPHGDVRYCLTQTPDSYHIFKEVDGNTIPVKQGMDYRQALVDWTAIATYEFP